MKQTPKHTGQYIGTARAIAPPVPPEPQSELAMACDRLHQQVVQVDLATQELERRLMPVLRPAAPDANGTTSASTPATSPLTGTIDQASDSLLNTTARMASLLDRLATA